MVRKSIFPPLRERPDKKSLIHDILQRELNAIAVAEAEALEICPEVIELFEQHPWPGNIRQLINVIRATLYTAGGRLITVHDLPLDFLAELKQNKNEEPLSGTAQSLSSIPLITNAPVLSLSHCELRGIKTALKECDGNISLAAKKLGITRSTLYKKLDHFRLDRTGEGLLV